MNPAVHENQARAFKRWVYFLGSVALCKGQGLSYDRGYYTDNSDEAVTDPWGRRDKVVRLPSGSYNEHFAGATVKAYRAKPGGQWVEIFEPGSVCEIAASVNTTVNATLLTCSAGAGDPGRFGLQGLPGRGTALALQTKSNVVLQSDLTGASALDATGKILTDGAATFVTNGVAAGDKVMIVAGENDGSNETAPGQYTVSSVDSETQLTLTEAASDGGTMQVSYYIISGNPLVLAYLYDGAESGLQEIIMPIDNTAVAAMVGGTTFVAGGVTLGAGASTHILADGVKEGLKKVFAGLGALTTNGYVVTVTSGIQADGATALASVTLDAANEIIALQWNGCVGGVNAGLWRELISAGATKA